MSTQEERAMAYYLCKSVDRRCSCESTQGPLCYNVKLFARAALGCGAKLPDPRMERGRAAYEAFLADKPKICWTKGSDQFKEDWARVAEAARAAP